MATRIVKNPRREKLDVVELVRALYKKRHLWKARYEDVVSLIEDEARAHNEDIEVSEGELGEALTALVQQKFLSINVRVQKRSGNAFRKPRISTIIEFVCEENSAFHGMLLLYGKYGKARK